MSADRNLLFGMLALHNGFLTRDQLLDALNAWMLHRATPVGQLLCDRGVLHDADRRLLDGLVGRQVERHGDAAQSLASVRVEPAVRDKLERLIDSEIQASVASLGRADETTGDQDDDVPPPPRRPDGELRYRTLRPHARGGLGEVFVAVDEELHREVALKEIQERFADDPGSRRRFVREAEVTGNLEHPGVVPVYGLLTHPDGRPVYAMRFIHGESLQAAIAAYHAGGGDRLGLRKLLSRFVAVCNAVAYAHTRGVIHRDLKQANVMLGEFGETLVVDWGLAKVLEQSEPDQTTPHRLVGVAGDVEPTLLGQAVGTPAFMPPEQARGEHDRVGVASDVWALGAALYCLLTGSPPYAGVLALERARRCEFVPPNLIKQVPPALAAVCQRAMAADPAGRYPTERELAAEVERWLADEPVTAYREPLLDRARRWGRRHRTLATSGVVLLAVSVVALSGVLWAVGREQVKTAAALDKATMAEAEARKNFEEARRAVDECFGMAKEDDLLQGEYQLKVRKLLLSKTLPFYQSFTARMPAEEGLAEQRADYLVRVAFITSLIGSQAEAVKYYEQACDLRDQVARAHPEVAKNQIDLAAIYGSLGLLLQSMGKMEDALKSYEQARDILERVHQSHPKVAGYQANLANAHANLGVLFRQTGMPEEALKCYEQARDIQQRLRQTHPEVADYQIDLASTYTRLADFLNQPGNPEAALKNCEEARGILEELHKARPEILRAQEDLAATYNLLGRLQRQLDKPEDELKYITAGRDIVRRLQKAHPEVLRYQHNLAAYNAELADVLATVGRTGDALMLITAARDILQQLQQAYPEVLSSRANLAYLLNKLGCIQNQMGKPEDAVVSFEQARAIQQELHQSHPAVSKYSVELIVTLANLGFTHRCLARFEEALTYNRQAAALAGDGSHVHQNMEQERQLIQHTAALDRKLAAVSSGTVQPASDAERVELAKVAGLPGRKLYLTAAALFAEAFRGTPTLAAGAGYWPACVAALASTGQGKEARSLDATERAQLRYAALGYLQATVKDTTPRVIHSNKRISSEARSRLIHLRIHPDLACVREPDYLLKLPEAEQVAWRNLWAEVDDLLKRPREKSR